MLLGQERTNGDVKKGDAVYFDGEAGTTLGVVSRSFPQEDKYTLRLFDSEDEFRKADGCFRYFRGAELEPAPADAIAAARDAAAVVAAREVADAAAAPAPAVPPPEKRPRLAQPAAKLAKTVSARPNAMNNLKKVLGGMFTGPRRFEGRVRWFSKDKGYGKIAPVVPKGVFQSEAPENVFFHKNDLEGGVDGESYAALADGVLVTYELVKKAPGYDSLGFMRFDDKRVKLGMSEHGAEESKLVAGNVKVEGRAKISLTSPVEIAAATTAEEQRLRRLLMRELRTSAHQEIGRGKATMDDRFVVREGIEVESLGIVGKTVACAFYGVFDGHAGGSCSEFVSLQLDRSFFECLRDQRKREVLTELAFRSALLAAFRITQHNFMQYTNKLDGGARKAWVNSGSTACIATVFGPDDDGKLRLHIANCGDSRAVIGKKDGRAARLSTDHTPELPAERKRVEQQGGAIAQIGGVSRVVLRVRGQIERGLSVTRSFGDADFKTPGDVVSAVPEVSTFVVDEQQDLFLILATDGIFASLTDGEAVRIVTFALRDAAADADAGNPTIEAARRLVAVAHERNASDDKTALVVLLGDLPAADTANGMAAVGATAEAAAEIAAVEKSASVPTYAIEDDDPYGLGESMQNAVEVELAKASEKAPVKDDIFVSAEMDMLDDLFLGFAAEMGFGEEENTEEMQDNPYGLAMPAPQKNNESSMPAKRKGSDSAMVAKKKTLSAKAAKKAGAAF